MDLNHNEIGGSGDAYTDASEFLKTGKRKPLLATTGSYNSHSSFDKLQSVHSELVLAKDVIHNQGAGAGKAPSDDVESKAEGREAQLLVHISKYCTKPEPPVNGLSPKAARWSEVAAIMDKKERDKESDRLALCMELTRYKGLYYSLSKEHQSFKTTVHKSLSSCKDEMGISIESLLKAQKDSVEEVQKEKANLATELARANSQIISLEGRIQDLHQELALAKAQYKDQSEQMENCRLNGIVVKSKCDDLNQSQNIVYDQFTAAEEMKEGYKRHTAELTLHNAYLLDSIKRMSEQHSLETSKLKEEVQFAVNDAHEQRETFTGTISELTAAFECQVGYTKKMLSLAKARQCDYEAAQTSMASYIGKIIQQCTTTVICLEKGVRAGEAAKRVLEKEVKSLTSLLKTKDEARQDANPTTACANCGMLPGTKAAEVVPKANSDTPEDVGPALTRISDLERLAIETHRRLQRAQGKCRRLSEKSSECKKAAAKNEELIEALRQESKLLQKEVEPLFSDQMSELANRMKDAQVKHEEFQAFLQGIEATNRMCVSPKEPSPPATDKKEE